MVLAACLGAGLLLKGLLAVMLPAGAALVYLALTRQLFSARTWERLRPITGLLVIVLIAAPWHVLATRRNPPYFDFPLHSGPGMYEQIGSQQSILFGRGRFSSRMDACSCRTV